MLFAANIAVEQKAIMAAITIALMFTHFWCTSTHIQSKPGSDFDSQRDLTTTACRQDVSVTHKDILSIMKN